MRWAVATLLAGCTTYHAPSDPSDASADSAIDTDPETSCLVDTSGTPIDRGTVGLSSGGGMFGSLQCADNDQRIVGIGLDMSDGEVNGTGGRSAHGISIACATLTIDSSGAHVGPITSKLVAGGGGSGWTPSTPTPIAQCPDDGVVSGLSVHGGAVVSNFLDATVQCTRLDSAGHTVGSVMVPVTGSGTDNQNPSSGTCAPTEQLSALSVNTGAGLDSVDLQCQETLCQ